MSFGTGQHVTTRGCLGLMDRLSRLVPHASFLDIGCGSGILSIAASKLGYQSVTGIDNDPDAVRIAQENARNNNAASECRFTVHDAGLAGRSTYDVVAANMLARELEEGADGIAESVSRGGILILAGTLKNQWKPVIKRFRPYGFREAISLVRKGWTCGCLVRDLPGCRRQKQLVRQVRNQIVAPRRRKQAG
jgi:ribosomal protein L11 methyltransferase